MTHASSLIESLEGRQLFAIDFSGTYAVNGVKLPYITSAQTKATVTFTTKMAGSTQYQAAPVTVLVASKDKKYDAKDTVVAQSIALFYGGSKNTFTQTVDMDTSSLKPGAYYLISVVDPGQTYHNSYYEQNVANNTTVSKRTVLTRYTDLTDLKGPLVGTKGNDRASITKNQDQTIVQLNRAVYAIADDEGLPGDVTLQLGAGNDRAVTDAAVTRSVNLFGGAGNDFLVGGSGVDSLDGGTGNDRLYGMGNSDILNGGLGNDLLVDRGTKGIDSLYGGEGDDSYQADSRDYLVDVEKRI